MLNLFFFPIAPKLLCLPWKKLDAERVCCSYLYVPKGNAISSLCSYRHQPDEPSPNENTDSIAQTPISCSQSQQQRDDDHGAQDNNADEEATSSSGAATSETNMKCISCGCDHDSILKMATCGIDADPDALLRYIRSLLTNATQPPSSSQNPQQSDDEKMPSFSYVDLSDLSRLKDLLSDSGNCASDLKESLSKGGTDVLKDGAEILLKGIGKAHCRFVHAGFCFGTNRNDVSQS